MSSSIAIPAAPSAAPAAFREHPAKAAASSSSSSFSSSPRTPQTGKSTPAPSARKQPVVHERRPSLLSSAISKQEAHVVNIGDPEGPPRLITYVESSQGFTWNPEIFLPSYVDCDYTPLENRREPVHEIRLTDEEIKNMFPQ